MAAATRCAVVGDPVDHSLSPVLHRAGYAALGLDGWTYDAVQVPAGGLAAMVAGLGPEWRGLSVTAPLKREALATAVSSTDRAGLAGGANTLVRGDSGAGWAGDNTDLPGAVEAIRERWSAPVGDALVLGGGATAASVGLALVELGVERLRLAVRDPGRAAEALSALMAHPRAPEVSVTHLTDARGGDLVVSTIPAAAQTPELVQRLDSAPVLFEVTYNTWPTPLVAAAERRGAVVVSGLDLLVHQAVLQFEMFTGRRGPLGAMRAAGEAALAVR
ncbi:MAG: shikimate dehydrogenase [Nocardioidaceae bacterium]|nr:shikimate dehydrogenase [Nocardioidaceae bacterium]MCL2612247.1 shikimate dehydrogenase [Nocardioidaceae bacterium]